MLNYYQQDEKIRVFFHSRTFLSLSHLGTTLTSDGVVSRLCASGLWKLSERVDGLNV